MRIIKNTTGTFCPGHMLIGKKDGIDFIAEGYLTKGAGQVILSITFDGKTVIFFYVHLLFPLKK